MDKATQYNKGISMMDIKSKPVGDKILLDGTVTDKKGKRKYYRKLASGKGVGAEGFALANFAAELTVFLTAEQYEITSSEYWA